MKSDYSRNVGSIECEANNGGFVKFGTSKFGPDSLSDYSNKGTYNLSSANKDHVSFQNTKFNGGMKYVPLLV